MGALILHDWARLLALAAAAWMIWGSFWAILFKKFFWDMIGGTLGPAGIIPGSNATFFETIIVKIPVLQIINMILGVLTVCMELPLPFLKGTSIHGNFGLRAIFYFLTGFLGIFVYQTVDCSIYYVIASLVYLKAHFKGEIMEVEGKKHESIISV